MDTFTAEDLSMIGGIATGYLSPSLDARRNGRFIEPSSCIWSSPACNIHFPSLLLVFLGGSYVLLFLTGKGGHTHSQSQPMEKMAVAGLVLVPALSPCATTLLVFLAVGNSKSMMILAIIVLLFSTILVMTSLVALSFYGASQLRFHWVERYDKLLVGSVLCLVGILTLLFHHHEHGGHETHQLHRKIITL